MSVCNSNNNRLCERKKNSFYKKVRKDLFHLHPNLFIRHLSVLHMYCTKYNVFIMYGYSKTIRLFCHMTDSLITFGIRSFFLNENVNVSIMLIEII